MLMLLGTIDFNRERLDYPKFLFCGSFNPMHDGHIKIADYIYDKYNTPVDFEISLNNVEKTTIPIEEVRRRYEQMFTKNRPAFGRLYITDEARYLEKARIFPDVTFVCGYDTMRALCSGDYYNVNFEDVIAEFEKLGNKFLVFPRHKEDGSVGLLDEFPPKILEITSFVEDFVPIKVSSRELRRYLA